MKLHHKSLANWHNNTALVLDDHSLFTESFSALLEKTGLFSSVTGFSEESLFVENLVSVNSKSEAYIFLDYYLKDNTSQSLISYTRKVLKHAKIIVVSSITNPILINNVLSYKIDGFLSKTSSFSEVVECIKCIQQKQQYISGHIQKELASFDNDIKLPFSAREIEILNHFAMGLSVNATAETMLLSPHTIVSHRRKMMGKTNSKSIAELLAYARKIDLI
ncbi:LuxR C-terminal-related transcriptional regulator [Polluticaenibacter yanchengensis]|uniref:Response regulator transcription factor n=1 Tax=Polluticaenibacter yanchengensis TaxID=3014562 RepID=A0ABT4UJ82_9BACT|nr:response regulator transcription factor [Chitinophagaceae bacterium LY-5]